MSSCRTCVPALLLLLAGSGAVAQARDPAAAALAAVRPADLAAHVAYLASDALAGRAPGTRGSTLAAEYIAAQFARAGLRPLGPSFLHEVPMIGWRADTAASYLAAVRAPRLAQVERAHVVLWSPTAARAVDLTAPLVFAGYGIRAPEYGWNDYQGDVRGRIVLVLPGEPAASAAFDGAALTYYGRWSYKVEEAVRQGASAVLLLHDDAAAGYGWDVVRASWGGEVLALAEDTSAALPRAVGWITSAGASELLARSGHSLAELQQRAAHAASAVHDLNLTITLQLRGHTRPVPAANVIGMLPGRAGVRAREWVVHTAHYDHLGVGPAADGDSIYNGAYDNASGVAALLEVADAFGRLRAPPRRSLLFIATTGEEAGLLGATWLTRHPPVPLGDIVAVVNTEGANLWGETEDVGAIGAERSTLGELLQRAAAQERMRAVAERAPAHGFWFRTDAYPFARAGVPALTIEHGLEYRGRSRGWGDAVVAEYLRQHYHRPSDEYRDTFDLSGAEQQVRVTFRLLLDIANRAARPQWY